ncbi:NAD(P)H-binding protein [Pseudonocardia alaniniphila]|uniref:NAD(P)H-binding protein n=1 Tax=Pseudonocardia alaniniphila TaxID=75291 RepID=A0ABS9TTM0_9PSEU|nr:NAD(P)H-binding protein [Pseudonocardia alaniniphila]MCH6171912.1 NAD(P)H-binding protein [Pseudonocardia alaniniphila]
MTILVTGATGTVGRHLVRQLAEAGHPVRALTRNPAAANMPPGVEVVAGDLTDPDALAAAFTDVTGLHLITFGGDAGEALTTGPQLVALATKAGVRRVSVLSGWEESSVEVALRGADIGWTLLAPKEFMSSALEWAGMVREGAIRVLANWPSAVVHEADIAAVAATALTEDGHAEQTYVITGPHALTSAERTRLIGEAIGREVTFDQLNEDQERERLQSYGYPDDYVEFGIQLATNPPPQAGVVEPTVEQVTGRPARTFAQWAAEHADAFR